MRLPIFLLLLATAFVTTFLVLKLGTDRQGADVATLLFALSAGGMLVWILVAMTAFDVVTISDGIEYQHSYPSLAAMAALGAGVNLFAFAKASIETIDFGGMTT